MNHIVTVVRDFSMYERCLKKNPRLGEFCLEAIDNRVENQPVPVLYNRFIGNIDPEDDGWIVFCHEDFEIMDNLVAKLQGCDKNVLYGAVGSARRGLLGFGMQVVYGNMLETQRNDFGKIWQPGRTIANPTLVETFDCCCLIVHSSLIRRYDLRFDEALEFDLYVEDFCASAMVTHGIRSIVLPFSCCHHSGSQGTERLTRHLSYLKGKYPNNSFAGTIAYFGTPSWQKRFQDSIMNRLRS